MPLDWDRPWQVSLRALKNSINTNPLQAWPLTSAYMAVIGHLIGSGVSLAISIAQFLLIEAQSEKRTD
jgi:hypothetical protein